MKYLVQIIFPSSRRGIEARERKLLLQRFTSLADADEAGWMTAKNLMDQGTNALYRILNEDGVPADLEETKSA